MSKQGFLKAIAVSICIVILILFCAFAALSYFQEVDVTLPFLLTVFMGMAAASYVFLEARKNFRQLKLIQLKRSRGITLLNKVKIKSVNNRNYLEYAYSKYMVDNYEELKTRWEEYVKVKEEAKRYQSNTELLEFYNNELINGLRRLGIKDSEIWIYQPTAILDKREMVEVRHRLHERRQKLRERIDINNKQIEDAVKTIQDLMKAYPDCKEEAERILRKYNIVID